MEDWKIKRHEFARYVALEKQNMAVIEAAKAYVRAIQTIEPRVVRERYLSYQAEPWPDLRKAVEALEATEAPDTPPDATG